MRSQNTARIGYNTYTRFGAFQPALHSGSPVCTLLRCRYMLARIQSEFLRIDRDLRDGCNLRSSLKSNSVQAWKACGYSLAAFVVFLGDDACIFSSAADNKSAATWVQWRKSNTSKQLLGLVRSILDAIASEESRREVSAPVRQCIAFMMHGLHAVIIIVRHLHAASTSSVLWPAMREWLVEPGGVDSMWRALAWATHAEVTGATGGITNARALSILDSVGSVLSLSLTCPKLPPHPNDALLGAHGGGADAATAALQLTLGEFIPAAFPAMQPDVRTKAVAIAHRISLMRCSPAAAGGGQYLELMHLPALRAWPYLVGAARHQLSLPVQNSKEREGIQVRRGEGEVHEWCRGPRCMAHGAWCMVHGAWCMVHGAWRMGPR